MKKIVLIALMACGMHAQMQAQPGAYRKLRADEINYMNTIRGALYSATPHTYSNWKVVADGAEFDARRFWCGIAVDGQDCVGDCPKNLGVSEVYTLSYNADYNMASDESASIASTSMLLIKDYTNAGQLAAAQKFSAKIEMKINMVVNSPGTDFAFSYCANTQLETIQLPVPATMAVIAMRSVDCPIMESGRASMSADYYDRALIVLGTPVAKKKPEKTSDGLTTNRYTPAFDRSKISKPITQSITVEIKGDADDIRALIKLIDWKKLNDMIGR